ncbi:hypothetical protein ACH4A3_29550 [Streptomyces sp. NPDC018007]|uniref:hypothetical protein n=1 Tax=Streptomyces sp. NPDC018007 TaxID=3365029 RepID=UPI0037B7370E
MRQISPTSARLRPTPRAGRPEIVFDPHSPTEFQHEHYKISLRKRLAETPSGGVLEITAHARVDVPDVAGPSAVTAADLRRQDQDVEDGLFARAARPGSDQPWVAFPPYRVVVDSASEEEVRT